MLESTDEIASGPRLGILLVAGCLTLASGCNTADVEPVQQDRQEAADETKNQTIGESSVAYSFDGIGDGLIPSYQERVAFHLINRFRLDPANWNLTPPMSNRPYPPQPPYIYDEGVSEAGRWLAQHGLETGCACPTSPMAGPPAFNSCCEMARKDGKVQCVSEKLKCSAESASTENERWNLLNRGKASISFETYFQQQVPPDQAFPAFPGELIAQAVKSGGGGLAASSQSNAFGIAEANTTVTPEECKEPEDPCQIGTCTNLSNGNNLCDPETNPDCKGACKGGSCGGVCQVEGENGSKQPLECTLPTPPDPENCTPENYPKGYFVSMLQASTAAEIPTLLGGIHMKLGATVSMKDQDGLFGITPPKKTRFSIHYYEPTGEAKRSKVIIDGNCRDLEVTKRNVAAQPADGEVVDEHGADAGVQADAGADTGPETDTATGGTSDTGAGGTNDTGSTDPSEGYYGLRYGKTFELQPGCHRYVFSFADANGFEYTYPEHGSLGAKIVKQTTENGDTLYVPVQNDENCPIWSSKRPDMSCLPKGTQCIASETRPCYTGRANTRGTGICKLGTESCKNGRWSGTCEDQVTPEASESCGDGKDNDCNGFVDEGCGTDTDPDTGGTGGMPDGGMTGGMPDGGSGGMTDGGTGGMPDGGSSGGDVLQVDDDDDDEGGCSTSSDEELPSHLPALLGLLLGLGLLRRRG